MEISRHCTFCDHKEFDFMTGNLCGLTGKKADFIRKCPRILFDVNAKEEIAKINLDYKSVNDEKRSVTWHLILYSILGVAIIVAGICLAREVFGSGQASKLASRGLYLFSTGSIVVIAGGMSVIGYAFAPYIKYTNTRSVVKSQKREMDNLLALYDYDYKIDFEDDDEYEYTQVKLYRSKRPVK